MKIGRLQLALSGEICKKLSLRRIWRAKGEWRTPIHKRRLEMTLLAEAVIGIGRSSRNAKQPFRRQNNAHDTHTTHTRRRSLKAILRRSVSKANEWAELAKQWRKCTKQGRLLTSTECAGERRVSGGDELELAGGNNDRNSIKHLRLHVWVSSSKRLQITLLCIAVIACCWMCPCVRVRACSDRLLKGLRAGNYVGADMSAKSDDKALQILRRLQLQYRNGPKVNATKHVCMCVCVCVCCPSRSTEIGKQIEKSKWNVWQQRERICSRKKAT